MAEAAVEEPHRFFCHKCSLEINRVLSDYTCPNCCCGFVEALENQAAPVDGADDTDDDELDVVGRFDVLNEMFLGDSLAIDLRRHGGRNRRGRDGRERNRREGWDGRDGRAPRYAINSRTRMRPGVHRNNRGHHMIEHLFHFIAMNWSGNGRGGGGGPHEFFLGNPGDYAWGREGLDAVVSHLMSQMDQTLGPPPLTKEKIDEIPVVVITQEQVDKALQCSVCWENFKVDEPVRQLVCTHVYHEGCIIPWLELNGTCPVCRKPQSSESEETSTQGSDGNRELYSDLLSQVAAVRNVQAQARGNNTMDSFIRTNFLPQNIHTAGSTDRNAATTSSSSSTVSGNNSTTSSNSSSTNSSSNGVGGLSTSDSDTDSVLDVIRQAREGVRSSLSGVSPCNSSHSSIQDMDVD